MGPKPISTIKLLLFGFLTWLIPFVVSVPLMGRDGQPILPTGMFKSLMKRRLIELAGKAEQQEVRWHLAQLLSRLELSAAERRRVVEILAKYLTDTSKIVKTFSMQTLADIAAQDSELRGSIIEQLERLTRTGSPAMKSRGRKLLARLKQSRRGPTSR